MIAFAYCQRSLRRLKRKKQMQNKQRVSQQKCSNMQRLLFLDLLFGACFVYGGRGTGTQTESTKLSKELETCCDCLVAFLSSVRLPR